jgi:hypothetical protein
LAPGDSVQIYRGAEGQLRVAVPRLESADVRVDARLDEPEWRTAAVLTGFTNYEPVEGVRAVDDTEVRVFYTADALYFGIRAHDSDPGQIRAKLGERDRSAFNDDWVRIMLDTFGDQRNAYIFYVNPLGIQTDGNWQEGRENRMGGGSGLPVDFNPDYIWASEGRVEGDGWTAEIRIPYVSLRFRELAVQDWGLNVARETRRNGFKSSWAPLTKDKASTLAQSGQLVGLRDVHARRLVEVNPVVTGKRVGQTTGSGFAMEGFSPEAGLNARLGITQNLVADATYNPDFSQIEADADQITVNERFAINFPEKRPFFLEGTEIFRTPQQLVYTRAVVDPVGGAKVTGKLGAFNVAYLGALDESARPSGAEGSRAAFNMVRVQRDLGTGSAIGALYTDRTLTGGTGFNRVAGVDTRLLLRERYTVTAQVAQSWTRASGVESSGPSVYASLERTGRRLTGRLTFEDITPEFRARSGFINRIGDARVFGQGGLTFYGKPGAFLERFNLTGRYEAFYGHDGFWDGDTPFESEIEIQPGFTIRGSNSINLILRSGQFRFEPELFEGFEVVERDGTRRPLGTPAALENMLAVALMPRLRLSNSLQLDGRLYLREVPIYAEGSRGFEFQAAPTIRVWPVEGLETELAFTRSRLWRTADESLFSTQSITRVKAQYQFTKALLARAIVQYNLVNRAALQDPRTGLPLALGGTVAEPRKRGDFGVNFLLSYEPSPGTLMYVGWTRQMNGPDTYQLDRLERTAEGLFVKVSYLVRIG